MRNDFQFNDNVLDEQGVAITNIYFAKDGGLLWVYWLRKFTKGRTMACFKYLKKDGGKL